MYGLPTSANNNQKPPGGGLGRYRQCSMRPILSSAMLTTAMIRMLHKTLPWALIGLLLTIIAGLLFLFQPVWLFHYSDFRIGNEIISRVESYRVNHGRLPESLADVGFSDDTTVYYRKDNQNHYIVWFGTLGESETYDSQTKKWD